MKVVIHLVKSRGGKGSLHGVGRGENETFYSPSKRGLREAGSSRRPRVSRQHCCLSTPAVCTIGLFSSERPKDFDYIPCLWS